MPDRIRTADLTAGERRLIERRRQNLSQGEAADAAGVSLYEWLQLETDEIKSGGPAIGILEPHEECFMLRRRKGLTAGEVAKKIGVSRYWLSRMERGTAPVETLTAFWGI
jgi:transcriptional regulator with XRE-family HTH domain